jgi:hypothetical protein
MGEESGKAGPVAVDPAAHDWDKPVGVHLVGSIPLASAELVFRRAAAVLGDRLRRIPDGETGERSDWIAWQYPAFSSRPEFEGGSAGGASYRELAQLSLTPGETAEDLRFDELGYARAALESYELFAQLKDEGAIPARCRFQVTLPTPLAPVSAFVALEDQPRLEPPYEARMFGEVAQIVAGVPAAELAIQWDTRYELAMLEGAMQVPFADVRGGILERLLRLSRQVPEGVELGYHLCYGDEENGHLVEPEDSSRLVEVANALAERVQRPLDWIHMPVPHGRDDDAYFEPMSGLALQPDTELYLGLVHPRDGVDGARCRVDAARRHVDGFGASSECGWGRGSAEAVEGQLALHRRVAAPLPAG